MPQPCANLLEWIYPGFELLLTPEGDYLRGWLIFFGLCVVAVWKLGLVGRLTVTIITATVTVIATVVVIYLVYTHERELNSVGQEILNCVAAIRH